MLHLRFLPQSFIYWELNAQCDAVEVIEEPMESDRLSIIMNILWFSEEGSAPHDWIGSHEGKSLQSKCLPRMFGYVSHETCPPFSAYRES